MWKIKVKTWGYAQDSFVPVSFEIKVYNEQQMAHAMSDMRKLLVHDVTFEVEFVGEEEFK